MIQELAAEAKKKQAKTLGKQKAGKEFLQKVFPGPMATAEKMHAEDKEKEKQAAGKMG